MTPIEARRIGRPCKISKEELLDSAEELFAEKGFDGTSIRAIAAKSCCNLALISYYFGSKEGLYEALLIRHFERSSHSVIRDPALLSKNWPEFKTPMPRQISAVLYSIAMTMISYPNMQRVVIREMMAGGKKLTAALMKAETSGVKLIRDEISLWVERGKLEKLDPRLATLALLSPLIYSIASSPHLLEVYGFRKVNEQFMRELAVHLTKTLVFGWSKRNE